MPDLRWADIVVEALTRSRCVTVPRLCGRMSMCNLTARHVAGTGICKPCIHNTPNCTYTLAAQRIPNNHPLTPARRILGMVNSSEPHTPSAARYRRGCRCDGCRKCVAAQRRRQRAAQPDAPRSSANILPLPTASQTPVDERQIGPVEAAVIAELETLPKTAEFQGLAAAARAVAAAIDDPRQRSYVSRNANSLKDLLLQLRTKRKKSGGRLAVVQQMSTRKVSGGP